MKQNSTAVSITAKKTNAQKVTLVDNKAKAKAKAKKPYVLPKILEAKYKGNKKHKAMIGGFNFLLNSIKVNAVDYVNELHSKYEFIIVSMADVQKLKPTDLTPFMSDKEKERQANNGNLWSFYQIETLLSRYYAAKNKAAKK